MTDDTVMDAAVDAQESFRVDVWQAVAEGELNHLTKHEMAVLLHEIADSLDRESWSRSDSSHKVADDLDTKAASWGDDA